MKSFEQIVDDCFRPYKRPIKDEDLIVSETIRIMGRNDNTAKLFIRDKYNYSSVIGSGEFYGADINEPVVKICRRILGKPNRFYLVRTKTCISNDYDNGVHLKRSHLTEFVVADKDTNQKFVIEQGYLKLPSFLTKDENTLLVTTLKMWYDSRKDIECEKKLNQEQKRKDKFRQELTDLYKDL